MTEAVVEHFASLVQALDDAQARWAGALGGLHPSAVVDDDVDAMSDADLLGLNDALSAMERRCQALHARVANGISKRSARELGKDGLARKAGFTSPEKLIAASTGGHPGDAKRLIQVGDATAGRILFSGERAPAKHPHVATAVENGTLSMPIAAAINTLLDKVACKTDRDTLENAERILVGQAAGLSLKEMEAVLARAEAHLDPDGVAPNSRTCRPRNT